MVRRVDCVLATPAAPSCMRVGLVRTGQPRCARWLLQGVHSVAYSPLGHTGQGSEVLGNAAVAEVAAEAGKSPAQVCGAASGGPGGGAR